MSLALGPVARLMTTNLYDLVNTRAAWCHELKITREAVTELKFWSQSYVYMYVRAQDGHTTIAGDATFTQGTWHAMGSVDTGSPGVPSKPGCMRNRHGTAPLCSCANGMVHARNNGRQQRDLFTFKMAFCRAVLD